MAGAVVDVEQILEGLVECGVPAHAAGGVVHATPGSAEQVADVLRWCGERGVGVEIAGAGTKRAWGGKVEAQLVLETRGLAGVREHSWQDMTATVGAGTTWAEMQRVLKQHRQMVALDPAWEDRATVGGVLAANESGAWRLRYGSARDLVIGMTIVLADGTIARSGGKVVKNVAGYDLHKLMIGAYGTLGVIAEVTFRLHPLPNSIEIWSFRDASARLPGELMMKVLDSQLGVEAMQIRARAAEVALDVALTGQPKVLAGHSAKLAEMCGSGVMGSRADAAVFAERERLLGRESDTVLKITMLPSSIGAISDEVVRRGGEAVTQATGVMTAVLPDANAGEAIVALQAMAKASGSGTVSVLRGNGGMSMPDARVFAVMQEIKRRFDPQRMLNRGCMGGV